MLRGLYWRPEAVSGRFEAACGWSPIILPARGTSLSSAREMLPASSTHHNQPRMPSFTPTSRKVAVGEAQRGFPRAGGQGDGDGHGSLITDH